MLSRIKYVIAILIIFILRTCYADSAADTLNQLLNQTNTLRADFTQTITDKTDQPVQRATGRMALERPGKFRWEVVKPVAQTVVANGKKLWIYDPDLEQVTIRLISKEMGETPALLLSNTEETLAHNFTVQEAMDPKTHMDWFLLTPKNENSMLALIRLGFINQKIRMMNLEDHLGHTTIIEFKNVQMNPDLSTSTFQFKLPQNVDVIDETK